MTLGGRRTYDFLFCQTHALIKYLMLSILNTIFSKLSIIAGFDSPSKEGMLLS